VARPLRIAYPGAFYHITSRGNERKEIFKTNIDREKFLTYLASATRRYGAVIHVWCLMTNHYHLLLETPAGNLSEIMRHINGAYTTYFNIKRERSGHLLQGRYKAILVDADEYAQQLSCYIHLNPVRVGAVQRPEYYAWSSYRDYIGRRKVPEWLRRDFILGYFGGMSAKGERSYRKYVEKAMGQDGRSPLKEVLHSTFLGSEAFVQGVTKEHLEDKRADRDVPALRALAVRPSIEAIEKEVGVLFADETKTGRQVSLYLCRKYSGRKLKEIGTYFGISESGVSQAGRRTEMKIAEDQKFGSKVETIEGRLQLPMSIV